MLLREEAYDKPSTIVWILIHMAGEVCSPDSGYCHGRGALACHSSGLRSSGCIGARSHCQYPTWVARGGRFLFEGFSEASSGEASLYIPSVLICTSLSRSYGVDAIARPYHTV